MLYNITAQYLTPLINGKVVELKNDFGIFQTLIKGTSLEDAIQKAMERVKEDYDTESCKALINYGSKAVTILDENGHIVNHYWRFKGHEV